MGSYIPGLLEGTPIHGDNFALSWSVASGQTVSAGQVVKVVAPFTIQATSAATDFPVGVAYTSGSLNPAIGVVSRGIVDVLVDGAATAGDYLVASATTPGYVHDNGTTAPAYGVRLLALTSASTAGSVIQALLV